MSASQKNRLHQSRKIVKPSGSDVIGKEALRISLFRMHPEARYENALIEAFKNTDGGSLAVFKMIGMYDLACIYSTNLNHKILYNGTLKGIRSFSNIDCICWGTSSEEIIKKINGKNLLGLITIACDEQSLAAAGGIHDNQISKLCSGNGFHLNSLAWGEQVVLLLHNSFGSLWKETTDLISKVQPTARDLNSLFCVNMKLISKIDDSSKHWDEEISKSFAIFWRVDLICKANVLEEFHNMIKEANIGNKFDFEFVTKKRSATGLNLSYNINGGTWGGLIRGIRDIRKKASKLIVSTRLNIFESDGFFMRSHK
jgi:hypothetical protein